MSAQPDPQVLVQLLGFIERFDFEGYLDRLEEIDEEQLAYSLTQAAVAARNLAGRLLGRPPEQGDEDRLARVVAERHGRMLSPELGWGAELLAREVIAPGTALNQQTSGAILLYPVLLAALGSACDEALGERA